MEQLNFRYFGFPEKQILDPPPPLSPPLLSPNLPSTPNFISRRTGTDNETLAQKKKEKRML